MTTFYRYEDDGTVTASNLDPAAQPFMGALPDPGSAYEARGDIVGAFLARRYLAQQLYPACLSPQAQLSPNMSYESRYDPSAYQSSSDCVAVKPIEQGCYLNDRYESLQHTDSYGSAEHGDTFGYAGWASQFSVDRSYPDPEDIRHLHTLLSLLPHLQPQRKLNALEGPVVDIVENETGIQFADKVPKKLLVLLLGRKVVTKYIRTVFPEDNGNCHSGPRTQELRLPCGKSSRAAVKVLVAWMIRACQYSTMGRMKQIRIPDNLFVACSLSETMALFRLHKDAMRMDYCIAQAHFARPIFAVELRCLWNCLGEDNRFVYGAIDIVGMRLRKHEEDGAKAVKGIDDDMYDLLEENPRLEARVRDLKLNEKYRPTFRTNWMRNLGKNIEGKKKGKHLSRDTSNLVSSGKKGQGDRAITSLEAPLARPSDIARKFAILRIVPASTKVTTEEETDSGAISDKTQKE